MSLFEYLDSGLYKCPLRSLENEKAKCRKEEFCIAQMKQKGYGTAEIKRIEAKLEERKKDIAECGNGYDFSKCVFCTNGYFAAGHSVEECAMMPGRIRKETAQDGGQQT